jgi:hypothetical protein
VVLRPRHTERRAGGVGPELTISGQSASRKNSIFASFHARPSCRRLSPKLFACEFCAFRQSLKLGPGDL